MTIRTGRRSLGLASLALLAFWAGGGGDSAGACGYVIPRIVLANPQYPADAIAYSRGELGIVQPHFRRRFLIQAYRRLTGVTPAGADPIAAFDELSPPPSQSALDKWKGTLARFAPVIAALGTPQSQERQLEQYSYFLNCPDDAFLSAAATLEARSLEFGAASPELREWIVAQHAVFENCDADVTAQLTLPEPAPPGTPAKLAADRRYQVAAAHFYGVKFARAEELFRAIGDDAGSPWQVWGRYLAARALTRRALIATTDASKSASQLAQADKDLADVIANPSLRAVHQPARGLRQWIQSRLRPAERRSEAGKQLMTAPNPSVRDYLDYTFLMRRGVDDSKENVLRDDLTDWLFVLADPDESAKARAISRWKETRGPHWLIAALWRVEPKDDVASELLDAAAGVQRSAASFTTVSYLRSQLLIARGDTPAARALLASLPDRTAPGFPLDAINLLRSARLRVARTMDEWLRVAPRFPIGFLNSEEEADGATVTGRVPGLAFDADAALTLSEEFSLSRLVEVVRVNTLPARLRLKVTMSAWTRSVQLQNDEAGLTLAPILKALAPALGPDLDRYVAAAGPAERHAAGILLLLRWPGMHNYVPTSEEEGAYRQREPRSQIVANTIAENWWCRLEKPSSLRTGPYDDSKESPPSSLRYVPRSPSFLTTDDRAAASAEWQRLARLGAAPTYLAVEAVAWAESRPKDSGVPEALARAVKATRYVCGDPNTGRASRRAFALLHARYADTPWAKQTPYWYEGR